MFGSARYPMNAVLQVMKADPILGQRADWFGFGSFFNDEEIFSDIDLLAVCDTLANAALVRQRSLLVCSDWPIHLLVMTTRECAETKFIDSEACKLLMER